METGKLFDLEHLQQLSYERSRTWATFLDKFVEPENTSDIPIEKIDDHFHEMSEDEAEDDLASMEDENCDDKSLDSEVLRDITNTTVLAAGLMLSANTTNKTTRLSEIMTTNSENNELIDMLNQTLPVINEHNRQMKESGFDRILSTFDVKKIEEKVGGWLRRNNSLCGEDYHVAAKTSHSKAREIARHNRKHKEIEYLQRLPAYVSTNPYLAYNVERETDSDDSFHSGETARYIRSSRAGATKSSSSSTTMIKTYRMVKSTRQELREKYACDQDDDADSHLAKVKHRRRLAKEMAMIHCNDRRIAGRSYKPQLYQYVSPSLPPHSQRRKVLRKRTASNSCSAMESSSESDSYYYDDGAHYYHRKQSSCCNQRHCNRYAPRSATLTTVAASVRRAKCRTIKNIPCSRNERMYYYMQSHSHSLSSSSSSNSFSRTNAKKRLKRLQLRSYDSRPCRRESECRCCNEKRLCKEYKHLADTSTEEWFVENCFSPRKPQLPAPPIETEEVNTNNELKETEEILMEKLPLKSTRVNTEQEDAPSPPKKTRKKAATKTKKTKDNKHTKGNHQQQVSTDDVFELDLQMALKLSKEQYERDRMDKQLPPSNNLTTTNRNNTTMAETEETFLSFSKPMYNSTTVDNDKSVVNKDVKKHTNESQTSEIVEADMKRSKSEKTRKNLKLKVLRKEPCEQSTNDDHIFAKPQARPNLAEDTKNVANVGKEPPKALENSTTKQKQQTNEYPGDSFKDEATIQKISVTTKTVFNVSAQERHNLTNTINNELHGNKINDRSQNDNTSNKTADNTLSVACSNDSSGCSKNSNKDKKELEISNSTSTLKKKHATNRKKIKKSEQVMNEEKESKQMEKTNSETLVKPKGTKKLKSEVEQKESVDIPKKKAARRKAESKDDVVDQDRNTAERTKKSKNKEQHKCKKTAMVAPTKELNYQDADTVEEKFEGLKSQVTTKEAESVLLTDNQSTSKLQSKTNSTSNVTSTTAAPFSPELGTSVKKLQHRTFQRSLQLDSSSDDNDDNDCTVVTSTTNVDAPQELSTNEIKCNRKVETSFASLSVHSARGQSIRDSSHVNTEQRNNTIPSHLQHPRKGIVVYTPNNSSLAPAHSFSSDGGFFNITLEHLSTIIGQKPAEKFLKYYIGRRRFNSTSTVYFRPPMQGVLDTNDDVSSDSDEDDLECIGQYGDLYESFCGGSGNQSGRQHSFKR